MRDHFPKLVAPLLVVATLAAASSAHATPPPRAARSVYTFDVTITGLGAVPVTYQLALEEGRDGALTAGSNVPLGGNGSARQDVGVMLRLSYQLRGSALVVDGNVELSTADGATIHRVRVQGVVAVPATGAATLGSVVDAASGTRYEVRIAATRLL